jgi:hypothetical protein
MLKVELRYHMPSELMSKGPVSYKSRVPRLIDILKRLHFDITRLNTKTTPRWLD